MKLGGVAVDYLLDFYGEMDDGLNVGDQSDRFILHWDVASQRVADALSGAIRRRRATSSLALGAEEALHVNPDGEPLVLPSASPVRIVAVPEDIVAIRRSDPGLASRWRLALREAVEPVVSKGGRVVALTTEGDYVMEVCVVRIESVVAHEVAMPLVRPFRTSFGVEYDAARAPARGDDRRRVSAGASACRRTNPLYSHEFNDAALLVLRDHLVPRVMGRDLDARGRARPDRPGARAPDGPRGARDGDPRRAAAPRGAVVRVVLRLDPRRSSTAG